MGWLQRLFGSSHADEKELLARIEREEKASRSTGYVVAPAPYEKLAIHYS